MSSGKKKDFDEKDHNLFKEMMRDVSPLQSNRADTGKIRPGPSTRHLQDNHPARRYSLSDPVHPEDLDNSEELFYQGNGVQHSSMKKLRRGQLCMQAELDLHGFTINEAKQTLIEFLHDCQYRGIRTARIIHGKGYRSPDNIPVIKTRLAYWLKQHENVLAFCSARPADGGTGAVYVLLRSSI